MMSVDELNEQQAADADRRHRPVIQAWLKGKTQAEIGREFGVTRARIQQIIRRARDRGLLPPVTPSAD